VTRRRIVDVILAVVLVGLLGWLLVFAVSGSSAAPGSTPTEEREDQYAAITRAARTEVLAFLKVDHTNMKPLTDAVIDGATGNFKKQYESSVKTLTEAAQAQESMSTGRVDEIGLGEVDDDSATVYVAAGSKVQNKGTKGETQDTSWRIKLTMTEKGGRWLVSDLEFVG
jgi:Mce-associated membrane protein